MTHLNCVHQLQATKHFLGFIYIEEQKKQLISLQPTKRGSDGKANVTFSFINFLFYNCIYTILQPCNKITNIQVHSLYIKCMSFIKIVTVPKEMLWMGPWELAEETASAINNWYILSTQNLHIIANKLCVSFLKNSYICILSLLEQMDSASIDSGKHSHAYYYLLLQ